MVKYPYSEQLAEASSNIENVSPKAEIQAHPRNHHGPRLSYFQQEPDILSEASVGEGRY